MELVTNLMSLVAAAPPSIPSPEVCWDCPGISGLLVILNWVFTAVLVLCGIGLLLAAGAIAVGKFIDNGQVQSIGFKGGFGALIGAAICGSIVLILNWVLGTFGG